ncbi:MAG: polyphenol oxidase family protein [Treponema sp.]|jgi:YfiH family protein|nr:polyphenol oxidase family protein [Treponema sp.]
MSELHFSAAQAAEKQRKLASGRWVVFPFYRNGKPVNGKGVPVCGMSLKKAGSMRFRWSEENNVRKSFLRELTGLSVKGTVPVQLELVHSKTVYEVSSPADTFSKTGDGMITATENLLPVITVADCMPIFLYDPETNVSGILHSGWKGTGIVVEALKKAAAVFGSDPHDFCAVMGPHIHSCCYIVDEERAAYFKTNFGAECVSPVAESELEKLQSGNSWNKNYIKLYHLSLAKANLVLLERAGVRSENIACADDCTCCNSVFGSFRRETAQLPADFPMEQRWKAFTVQAAFCFRPSGTAVSDALLENFSSF